MERERDKESGREKEGGMEGERQILKESKKASEGDMEIVFYYHCNHSHQWLYCFVGGNFQM